MARYHSELTIYLEYDDPVEVSNPDPIEVTTEPIEVSEPDPIEDTNDTIEVSNPDPIEDDPIEVSNPDPIEDDPIEVSNPDPIEDDLIEVSNPDPKKDGPIEDSNFNPEEDARVLRTAMKGLGTDEATLINVLGNRTNAQRQIIKDVFNSMLKRNLDKDLKSELSGHFRQTIKSMMMLPAEFDAMELYRAMKSLVTNEDLLIEIMCSRTAEELRAIKIQYEKKYYKTLEDDIRGDTSGDFRRLLVSLATGGRSEDPTVDEDKAEADAKRLYAAGEKRWGTFYSILAVQSFPQLRAVFRQYIKVSHKDIEDSIKSEMSGDLEQGMLAIVRLVKNRAGFFAQKLYKSMKGLGTNDDDLIRLVVTQSEKNMGEIKAEFKKMYGTTLAKFIEGDTSGDYKKTLLVLISSFCQEKS